MKLKVNFLVAVLLLRDFILSQSDEDLKVGDKCVREYDNADGVCITKSECLQAHKEYKKKKIPETYCNFIDGQLILCCPQTVERISAQKCKEYSEYSKKKIYVWGLLLSQESDATAISITNCDESTPLIRGGNVTKTGEFPHMAAIGWKKSNKVSFNCGGSLISENYVLSAAHCEKSDEISPSFVRLGDQNLRTKTDNANETDINIVKFIKHPQHSYRLSKNDIALIKLEYSVTFTKYIRPACLWQSSFFNFTQAIATGWGATQYGSKTSDELMKVELDIFDNNNCNTILSDSLSLTPEKYLDNSQICAGILEGGKDTCQGDSGAPLQISFRENSCLYHIVGITSYGSALCGSPNTPAVYSRVSYYLDWIESIVWK
ncbi:hypothetical protein ACKWTF_012037 [Chironomus riparius]